MRVCIRAIKGRNVGGCDARLCLKRPVCEHNMYVRLRKCECACVYVQLKDGKSVAVTPDCVSNDLCVSITCMYDLQV